MKHMSRTMLVVVAALAASVACENNPTAPSDVVAQDWQLVSFQTAGSDLVIVQDPSRYTLRLEEDGRAAGKSDWRAAATRWTRPTHGHSRARRPSVDDSQLAVRGEGIKLHRLSRARATNRCDDAGRMLRKPSKSL
jgi:hypothetical protein